MFHCTSKLLAVLTLSISPCLAQGQDILYGDFAGSSVLYENVREDSQGLFGAPTLSGDTLAFTPLDFLAESNGGGINFTDGTLAFNLDANDGQAITSLTLEESGAFALESISGGTANTRVAVAAIFSVNILEVDGVAFNGTSQIATSATLLEANLVDSPGLGQAWQASAIVDIAGLAASQLGITGNITRASVVLDNQLLAISEDGAFAFVDKKTVDFEPFTVAITIPEPASAALIGLGSLALLARRRD